MAFPTRSSSPGPFNALVTGAGRTAGRALTGDQGAIAACGARIAMVWQSYLRHQGVYYGMERRWSDAPFWRRVQS